MSASDDEELERGSCSPFTTPPNYKPIEEEEFDFDVPEEYMNISLNGPFTCSSDSDSFDLDALLGLSKPPLGPPAKSPVPPLTPAREVRTDTASPLSTCDSAKNRLTSPRDHKEPKPTEDVSQSRDNLEVTFSASPCGHSSEDRKCQRVRHNTFTLSSSQKGVVEPNSCPSADVTLGNSPPSPAKLTAQVDFPGAQDQTDTASDSAHPLVTPPDPPTLPVNSRTYHKTSCLGLPASGDSSITKGDIPTSAPRLRMPSSLKKPSKACGTFNSSPLHCLHLDEIKSDLFQGEQRPVVGGTPGNPPPAEEKARKTGCGDITRLQSRAKAKPTLKETKRPVPVKATSGGGSAIVRRPSQLKKPLYYPGLPPKLTVRQDPAKQSARPSSKPVHHAQPVSTVHRPVMSSTRNSRGIVTKKPATAGKDDDGRSVARRRKPATKPPDNEQHRKDAPAGGSSALEQRKEARGDEEGLVRSASGDVFSTLSSSLTSQGKRKDKENEGDAEVVLAKKRRSFIPTPTVNAEGRPTSGAGPRDKKSKKTTTTTTRLAFPGSKFKEGHAPPLIKKATGVRVRPLRPLMSNTTPVEKERPATPTQDSTVDETAADFQ